MINMWLMRRITYWCLLVASSLCLFVSSSDRFEYSCLHKKDFRFFQNPPIETPALRDALVRYDRLHAEAEKRQSIKEAFESKSAENIKNKYIYVQMTSSGLGNRIMGLMSAFLLALLTDRILVVHSTTFDITKVLCSSFSNSTMFLHSDTDFSTQRDTPTTYVMNGYIARHFTEMMTSDMDVKYGSKPIWMFRAVEQYFMPVLFANPVYADKLKKWFPSRNVATKLMRYLLHPADEVWLDVLDSISQKDTMDYTVGLQLRTWISTDTMLKCFKHGFDDNSTHFFVASLANVEADLHKRNENWHITQKYMESHENHENVQTQHALHDMWLLSLTDETVVSAKSTFGYMIMGLKGEVGFMAERQRDPVTQQYTDSCYYPTSHEPCWHQASASGFEPNKTAYAELFTPCEDAVGGWRLSI